LEIVTGYVLKAFVLPPGLNLFGVIFATLFLRRWPGLRMFIIAGSITILWLWSTPFVAGWLSHSLEHYPPLDRSLVGDAGAIVVLGGGRIKAAPEYGDLDTVAEDTLARVRYGAKLARELGLALAVAGGSVKDPDRTGVGPIMAQVLREEFQTPVKWVEQQSRNTAQNASQLRALLPVQHIVLVTHAMHMPRAVATFERVGFTVTAAPMGFRSGRNDPYDFLDCLPSGSALIVSRAALHEWLGMFYYKLRY